jgi:hypothetical protein
LTVSGRADGQRLPHVRVLAGLTAKGQVLLDAPNVFLMAGTKEHASLLLRRDNRLVTAPAGEIVEVLLGVRLDPAEWLALMTGCVTPTPMFRSAQRVGSSIEVAIDGGRVFLDSRAGEWHQSFANAYGLDVNYRGFDGRQPIAWRASTPQGQLPDAAFAIEAADVRVNQPIPDAAFSIPNAESATPMTIEQLRAMFGRKGADTAKPATVRSGAERSERGWGPASVQEK